MSYKGGDRIEFGIIDNIDPSRDYGNSYEPEKYNCIAICDDVISDWWDDLKNIKTFFHCLNRPETALAHYGITLIPPESLNQLIDVITAKTSDEYKADALEIIEILRTAKSLNKYVICYGV